MTPSAQRAGGGRVLAFVDDLMDRSRISAAAPGVEFVRAIPPDLSTSGGDATSIAIVDGGRPRNLPLIEELVALRVRVLAFLPHVDSDGAERARRAGAAVLSRNRFFNDVSAGIAIVDEADTGQ